MSRTDDRKDLDQPTRVWMLEKDEDDKDKVIAAIQATVASFSRAFVVLLTGITIGTVLAAVDIILKSAGK
jgi:hypothetical protein